MKYHFDVRGTVHPLLVLSATLLVYVLIMPRSITFEDAGLFQMVCHLDGIGHPDGYPLFTNLCQPFVQLSIFSTGVFAGNFLSALFAALSCSVLFSCCLSITKDELIAGVAALAYGFSATFWSQAIIIEVYSLTVLMFLLCWRSLLSFTQTGNIPYLYLAIVVYGAGVANHWPLMVLSTPALLVTVFPRLDAILSSLKSPGFWLRSVIALLVGLSPYITILLARDAAISVYGDVDTATEMGRYVSRSAYSDQHVVASSVDRMRYMLWLLVESATQFGTVGLHLMVIGFAVSFKKLPTSIAISLVLMYVGSTYLLNFLLNFRYEAFWQAIFKPYPVVSYLALSIWLASGTRLIVDWLSGTGTRSARLMPWVATAIVVLSVLLANLYDNNRRNTTWVEQYGRSVLESLPKDAVFFANGDFEVGIFGFLHLVMGVRPDIELRSWDNLVFSNRLSSPFSSDDIQQARRSEFLQGVRRPVFGSSVPLAPVAHQGAYYRYTPGVAPSVERNPSMDLMLDHLLDLYTTGLITDAYENHFAYHQLMGFARQYVELAITHTDLSKVEFERLARSQSTFPDKLVLLERLLRQGPEKDGKVILSEIAHAAEAQIPAFATIESLAVFYEFYGRIMMMEPADSKRAIRYFEQSIDTYPVPENTSICPLLDLYQKKMEPDRAEKLGQHFPGLNCR